MTRSRASLIFLMLITAMPLGCASPRTTGPYAPADASLRRPADAERLALAAGELIDSEPDRAEAMLREALTADLYCGPAHNNLGVLYLQQGELYEAANEFEWARKLMPGHPDPRLNLGLTLELAGRTDDALDTYRTALEARPGHIRTIQALARLQLRARRTDGELRRRLEEVAMRGETEEWRTWARTQRLKLEP